MRKKLTMLAVVLTLALVGSVPALAQVTRAVVDCVAGEYYCIGTDGDDTITGSPGQDVILALDGDDGISTSDPRDFVFCGPGFDTVDRMPMIAPDDPRDQQGLFQYAPDPALPEAGFIAEDCEQVLD